MTRTSARVLTVTRPILQALTLVNLIYAAVIAALFVASFFIADWPMKPLGYDVATMHPQLPLAIRTIELIGLVALGLVHTILRRLLAIVDSVRGGDPFALDNATRLQAIAWSVLSIELIRLAVAAIATTVAMKGESTGISPAPWLAVLLLFVLSGIFSHGARLRADLDGTV